ncbi:MAG TPA: aldose 1-epimerase [Vicinamibacterales bacterium]|nr:aldose 1-epimerase [Vicinamibacterales bacterium]
MGRQSSVVTLATAMLLSFVTTGAQSPLYSARRNGTSVDLIDTAQQTAVSILPTVGNLTVEMKVKGRNVLREGTTSRGIPFLAPWADRLDEQAFYANGKRYAFDMNMGNVRGANPIHGFLSSVPDWQIVEARADAQSAWVTSRLEFFRHPEWMRQFPFAHTIEMTHRLRDGVLEVTTRIENLSIDPMPVAVGFHPFFQLTDSPRDAWTVSVAARTHWPVTEAKIPSGTPQPIEKFFAKPDAVVLAPLELDDVFSDLVRDARGVSTMTLRGKTQRLDVALGANYRAVVIYAPKGDFICIEPVVAIINGLNLAHKGLYKDLQSIPPGGVWQESFWVRPSGF